VPERHREVLLRRYGFGSNEPQTHADIAVWLA
jgi:hypothetical protein